LIKARSVVGLRHRNEESPDLTASAPNWDDGFRSDLGVHMGLFGLNLTAAQKRDLVEYLKAL
jgi:hypothetical protein